jgi:hypothetical protein
VRPWRPIGIPNTKNGGSTGEAEGTGVQVVGTSVLWGGAVGGFEEGKAVVFLLPGAISKEPTWAAGESERGLWRSAIPPRPWVATVWDCVRLVMEWDRLEAKVL